MKIVYLSMTGHTRELVNKLDMDSLEINPVNPFIDVKEPYVLIVPSYEQPMFNESMEDFIENNDLNLLRGVIGTGNLNFGDLYCFVARDLSVKYNTPLLYKLEYSGTPVDIKEIRKLVNEIAKDIL